MPNDIMDWSKQTPREVIPGFVGRFLHSDTMTFVLWEISAGAVLPPHSHPHEQVVNLYEGEFEMTVDGVTSRATGGTVRAIPGNAVHSGRAITNCRILDVFYPIRDDYRDFAGPTVLGDAMKKA